MQPRIVESSKAPLLTHEMIQKFEAKQEQIVEINISKRSAESVWQSDAAMLDAYVLSEHPPTDDVRLTIDDETELELEILAGVPFTLECAQQRLLGRYMQKDLEDDAINTELITAEAKLMVSRLIVNPSFTYKGDTRRKGISLDTYDDTLLSAFAQCCDAVCNKDSDDVFQVHIARDKPEDFDRHVEKLLNKDRRTRILMQRQPFQLNSTQATKVEKLYDRLRRYVLTQMITRPNLTVTHSESVPLTQAYPVRFLSEIVQQTLFRAVLKTLGDQDTRFRTPNEFKQSAILA